METNSKLPQWRREQIKDVVLSVLNNAKIGELPIDIDMILHSHGWLSTTIKHAESCGVVLEGTGDGYTIVRRNEKGTQFMIVYDDTCYPSRIRWTKAHEIGHIVLGHLDDVKTKFDIEAEANYFAREMLAPISVLDELGARTAAAIAQACNISGEAARIRANDFVRRDWYKSRHGNTENDKKFLRQFSHMFDVEFADEMILEFAV